jgi:hypothetical protein
MQRRDFLKQAAATLAAAGSGGSLTDRRNGGQAEATRGAAVSALDLSDALDCALVYGQMLRQ